MKTVHLCSRIQEVDQIIFIGSWSNDKSLNSVAVYEHEKFNKNRIRAVNQSLHYCSCGILTFPEEVLKFMDWLEFLICWCDRLQHRNEERIGIVILKIENHSEYSNTQQWKAKHVLLLQWLGAVPSSALNQSWNRRLFKFFSFKQVHQEKINKIRI